MSRKIICIRKEDQLGQQRFVSSDDLHGHVLGYCIELDSKERLYITFAGVERVLWGWAPAATAYKMIIVMNLDKEQETKLYKEISVHLKAIKVLFNLRDGIGTSNLHLEKIMIDLEEARNNDDILQIKKIQKRASTYPIVIKQSSSMSPREKKQVLGNQQIPKHIKELVAADDNTTAMQSRIMHYEAIEIGLGFGPGWNRELREIADKFSHFKSIKHLVEAYYDDPLEASKYVSGKRIDYVVGLSWWLLLHVGAVVVAAGMIWLVFWGLSLLVNWLP
jgi:hypothetical protein